MQKPFEGKNYTLPNTDNGAHFTSLREKHISHLHPTSLTSPFLTPPPPSLLISATVSSSVADLRCATQSPPHCTASPCSVRQMGGHPNHGEAMEWTEECEKFFLEILAEMVNRDPNDLIILTWIGCSLGS
ncbi:hypothetical protein RJT34_09347 [Clitoria ternatea]|uniref:Uncharacterized protein n=1 Tax=Clitoria ternatea TaxID=43366 RepID=A0AAN9PUK7_CLITE